MNKQQSWDDLGRSIEDVVNRAVNSQDFRNMAKNIQQTIESAADAGDIRRGVKIQMGLAKRKVFIPFHL